MNPLRNNPLFKGVYGLDAATLLALLGLIADASGFPRASFKATNDQQEQLLRLFFDLGDHVKYLIDDKMLTKASRDYRDLNAFLAENKFDPEFDPFQGWGAAAIIRQYAKWTVEGRRTSLRIYETIIDDETEEEEETMTAYPAYIIGARHVVRYHVPGATDPMYRLDTQDGHYVWFHIPDELPTSDLQVALYAQWLLEHAEPGDRLKQDLTLPMDRVRHKPDLGWLRGMQGDGPPLGIVFQQLGLNQNETGSETFAGTGGSLETRTPTVNLPFYTFTTSPAMPEGLDLAYGAVFVGTSAWQDPGEIGDSSFS